VGYHLAKLQVGGASALSNAVRMIVKGRQKVKNSAIKLR